jgi:hypothetical protein
MKVLLAVVIAALGAVVAVLRRRRGGPDVWADATRSPLPSREPVAP